jgi:Ureide permease
MPLVAVAMVGGALLSLGNLSFQWATAVYQASLTFALAIQASMTIVLGTGINYALEP